MEGSYTHIGDGVLTCALCSFCLKMNYQQKAKLHGSFTLLGFFKRTCVQWRFYIGIPKPLSYISG